MKTPDYVLHTDFTYHESSHDTKVLRAGSFVQPIDIYYIPKHIKDNYKFFDTEKETFCYTHYGIIVIPRNLIRMV